MRPPHQLFCNSNTGCSLSLKFFDHYYVVVVVVVILMVVVINISGRERRLLITLSEAVRAGSTQRALQQESVRAEHRRGSHFIARPLFHSVRNILQRPATRWT